MGESSRRKGQRPIWLGEDKRTWDHVRVHNQIATDPAIEAIPLAVYVCLAMYADIGSGTAHPSAKTIGDHLGLHERTIRRAIRILEAEGYVSAERDKGRPMVFRLLPPPERTPVSVSGVPQPDPGLSVPTVGTDSSEGRNSNGSGGRNSESDELEVDLELDPKNENQEREQEHSPPLAGEPLVLLGEPPVLLPTLGQRADVIVRDWWESREPKPAQKYVVVRQQVERVLAAGHDDSAVRAAMDDCPTISVGWLEGQLNRRRPMVSMDPAGDEIRAYMTRNGLAQ